MILYHKLVEHLISIFGNKDNLASVSLSCFVNNVMYSHK